MNYCNAHGDTFSEAESKLVIPGSQIDAPVYEGRCPDCGSSDIEEGIATCVCCNEAKATHDDYCAKCMADTLVDELDSYSDLNEYLLDPISCPSEWVAELKPLCEQNIRERLKTAAGDSAYDMASVEVIQQRNGNLIARLPA